MVTLVRRYSRLLTILSIAAMVGGGVCLTPAAADTDTAAQEDRPINIDVRDMAIGDVLRMLGQAANVNIIVGRGVSGDLQSLTLRNVYVEDALRLITEAQGFYWRKDGNVYVVSADPPAVTAGSGAPTVIIPLNVEGDPGQPVTGGVDVPAPTLPTEQASGTVVARTPAGTPQLITTFIRLQYLSAQDAAMLFGGRAAAQSRYSRDAAGHGRGGLGDSSRTGGSATGMGGIGLSRTGMAGAGLGQFGDDQDFGGGGGDIGGGFTQGGTGTGSTTTGGTTGSGGSTELLPGDMEPPVGIMRDNALLVRGTAEELDEFREILSLLDTPAKQVEIQTQWMDVATTASKALGIDWSVSNGALEVWNLGFAPGEASNNGMRYGMGRFWAELAVLENSGQAVVINQPKVTCMNGTPGVISFETEIPYFAATISYNQFGQRTVDYTSEFVEVVSELWVVPQINPDDSVRMQLSPQLQDQVGTVEGPNGERIPIITTQYVETMVRVPDGETVVLGGVVRKDESQNIRSTPLLSDIPIIGKLFQSRRKEITSTELLIFVTPRIIRDMAVE